MCRQWVSVKLLSRRRKVTRARRDLLNATSKAWLAHLDLLGVLLLLEVWMQNLVALLAESVGWPSANDKVCVVTEEILVEPTRGGDSCFGDGKETEKRK